jgi:hypothetical protein
MSTALLSLGATDGHAAPNTGNLAHAKSVILGLTCRQLRLEPFDADGPPSTQATP